MTVLTAESILRDLEQFRLLPPENYARAEAAVRRDDLPPARLVQFLTANGILTKFQADAITNGHAARLVFGPYVLIDRIGDGGMGVVYKARHARLERIDALKVIRNDKITSKVVARRFLREIRLTSSLQHPHIVRAYDAGTVETQLYLATEFVRGRNLAATVNHRGPLSVGDACLVAYQTALALQHIHEHNLIHRDVKPSNLLRDEATGAVKLLDLGLSGVNHEEEEQSAAGTLTRDGVLLGTPDYMAPEQAQNPHAVDIRADLYGLGCTLFFLLTGRPPYEGTSVEKLFKHSFSPPPPLVLPKGTAPPALVALVAKLMAKHPDDRYPDPTAVVKALLEMRPGSEPSIPHPAARLAPAGDDFDHLGERSLTDTPAPRSSLELPRRSRVWIYALAGAVVASGALLAIALGAFRSPAKKSTEPPSAGTPEEQTAGDLRDLRRAAANPAEDKAALRKRVLDLRARHPGTPTAVGAAQLLRKLPSPLDGVTAPQEAFLGATPGVWLSFSPADDRLFLARAGTSLEEWDVTTRRETGRYRGLVTALDRPVSVSADGRMAVFADDGKIAVAGKTASIDLGSDLPVRGAFVAPDGKTVAAVFEAADERIALIDVESGRIGARLDQSSIGVLSVVISPDGGTLAVVAADGVVRLFAAATGKKLNSFDADPTFRAVPRVAFAPDSQKLYVTGHANGMVRFALTGKTPEAVFQMPDIRATAAPFPWVKESPAARVSGVAVSADASMVAVGTHTGELRVYPSTGGRITLDVEFFGRIHAVAFSTDGRIVAVAMADGSVHLVPIKS